MYAEGAAFVIARILSKRRHGPASRGRPKPRLLAVVDYRLRVSENTIVITANGC